MRGIKLFSIVISTASFIDAFVTQNSNICTIKRCSFTREKRTRQMAIFDQNILPEISNEIDSVLPAFSSALLSDAAAGEAASSTGGGPFGFLAGPTQFGLEFFHSIIVTLGVNANAWGISILALTIFIKVVTYPLTKSQLESTAKMQTLQPMVKEIQTKYQSNPEVMNQKISEVYSTNQVNPLAGCLPAIVQIPVFVGLYRAIQELAVENKLDESFLWLPSLEGPTYGADPSKGNEWLFQGWQDGTPSLGWDDTFAFLALPAFLVVAQVVNQQIMQPKNATPEQLEASNNAVLKILPLFFGFFSLSVPSALSVYYAANVILTTLITLQIRSSLDASPATAVSTGASSTFVPDSATTTAFKPATLREKPAGFGAAPLGVDEVIPITPVDAAIDAEVLLGDEEEVVASSSIPKPSKKRGGKKKKRSKN